MGKNSGWNVTELKLREYDLAKYVMYNQEESVASPKWYDEVDSVIKDSDYQREAIKLVESDMRITMFNGVITPSLMLSNHEEIEPEILESLIDKILFTYIDKEHKVCLMHVKDCCGISYLGHIVVQPDIKLSRRFQERITQGILIQYEKDVDLDVIGCFLEHESIELKYKERVIEVMSKDDLSELLDEWEKDCSDQIDYIMQFSGDVDFDCFEEDEEEVDEENGTTDFEEVIKRIREKLGE